MIRPLSISSVKLIALGLLVLQLLSGCATLSKDECLNAEWYSIGYEDGSAGRPRSRLGDHREACAKYGVKPDPKEYLRGYGDGLAAFCVPKNGYVAGAAGRAIRVTCPADLSRDFNEAYRYGRQVYLVEGEYNRHRRAVAEKREQLGKLQMEIRKVEAQLVKGNKRGQHHGQRLTQTKALVKREVELEMQIAQLRGSDNSNSRKNGGNKGKRNGKKKGNGNVQANNGKNGQEHHGNNGQRNASEKGRVSRQEKVNNWQNERENGVYRRERNVNSTDVRGRKGNGEPAERNDRENVNHKESERYKEKDELRKKYNELVQVRQAINKLEAEERREQGNSRRERVRLLQEDRRLTRQEGQLESELRILEGESEGLLHKVRLLKRRSPY